MDERDTYLGVTDKITDNSTLEILCQVQFGSRVLVARLPTRAPSAQFSPSVATAPLFELLPRAQRAQTILEHSTARARKKWASRRRRSQLAERTTPRGPRARPRQPLPRPPGDQLLCRLPAAARDLGTGLRCLLPSPMPAPCHKPPLPSRPWQRPCPSTRRLTSTTTIDMPCFF